MNVEGLEEAVEEGKISGIPVNISTFRYTRHDFIQYYAIGTKEITF